MPILPDRSREVLGWLAVVLGTQFVEIRARADAEAADVAQVDVPEGMEPLPSPGATPSPSSVPV